MPSICFGLLLVAVVTVYFVSTFSQNANLTSRNFRTLERIAKQISSKMESLVTVFQSASTNPSELAYLESLDGFLGSRRALHQVLDSLPESDPFADPFGDQDDSYRHRIHLAPSGQGTELVLYRSGQSFRLAFERRVSLKLGDSDQSSYRLHLEWDLSKALSSLLKSNYFEKIAVVDGSGRVLEGAKRAGPALVRISKLLRPSLPFSTPTEIGFQDRAGASTLADLDIAGVRYKLFLVPIRIPFFPPPSEGAGTGWSLAGLVPAEKFAKESRVLPLTHFLVCFFLLTFLLLAWPVVAAWLTGNPNREGLRGLCMAAAALFLPALLTWAVLGTGLIWWNNRDDDLRQFAVKIRNKLEAEIKEALGSEYLWKGSMHEKRLIGCNEPSPKGKCLHPMCFPKASILDVAFLNSKGDQVLKYFDEKKTPLVNLGDRRYFEVFNNPQTNEVNSDFFWLDSIVSRTTGVAEGVLSYPVGKYTVALSLNLPSVIKPVLPDGYGFCIIDREGQVLFHSSPSLNLLENFFLETGHDAEFESRVRQGRKETAATLNYRGGSYRVRSEPLSFSQKPGKPRHLKPHRDLQLSLITFHDQQYDILPVKNAVRVASALFFLYAVIFVISALLLLRRNGDWLDKFGGSASSGLLLIYYLGTVAISLVILASGDSPSRIWAICASSLIALFATELIMKRSQALSRAFVGLHWAGLAWFAWHYAHPADWEGSRILWFLPLVVLYIIFLSTWEKDNSVIARQGVQITGSFAVAVFSILPALTCLVAASQYEALLWMKHSLYSVAKSVQEGSIDQELNTPWIQLKPPESKTDDRTPKNPAIRQSDLCMDSSGICGAISSLRKREGNLLLAVSDYEVTRTQTVFRIDKPGDAPPSLSAWPVGGRLIAQTSLERSSLWSSIGREARVGVLAVLMLLPPVYFWLLSGALRGKEKPVRGFEHWEPWGLWGLVTLWAALLLTQPTAVGFVYSLGYSLVIPTGLLLAAARGLWGLIRIRA